MLQQNKTCVESETHLENESLHISLNIALTFLEFTMQNRLALNSLILLISATKMRGVKVLAT